MEKTVTDKPLQVQAGKRYWRRDEGISGVLRDSNNKSDAFVDDNTPDDHLDRLYNADGRHVYGDRETDLISEYTEPTPEPQDEWGPWIGWNGGERPVDGDVRMQILSSTFGLQDRNAEDFNWESLRGAYRIKKEPETRECNVWWHTDFLGFHMDKKYGGRKAIITTQGEDIKIRWAD